jgi:hypothetical protein
MFTFKQYRDQAANYAKRAAIAVTANDKKEYHDLYKHFTELADDTQLLYDRQQEKASTPEPRRAGAHR